MPMKVYKVVLVENNRLWSAVPNISTIRYKVNEKILAPVSGGIWSGVLMPIFAFADLNNAMYFMEFMQIGNVCTFEVYEAVAEKAHSVVKRKKTISLYHISELWRYYWESVTDEEAPSPISVYAWRDGTILCEDITLMRKVHAF